MLVSDVNKMKSHPDKLLYTHIDGVCNNVKLLTSSKLAELVAIFHDLGKINPNFQAKIENKTPKGYSKHSYLSAFSFFCLAVSSQNSRDEIQKFLGVEKLTSNDIVAIATLIAKHHGNIPDFSPIDFDYTGRGILSNDEIGEMFLFLQSSSLPIFDYVSHYFNNAIDFSSFLHDEKMQYCFLNKFVFKSCYNLKPLDFYLDNQFAFSCVIQADKADAADFDNFITEQKKDVVDFCKIYTDRLNNYLSALNQNSALNKLRTEIRNCAVENIKKSISNTRIFDLTAPTGSGKTLMLLSLASEIVKQTGSKRIIYGLPFLSITEQVESEVLKIFNGYEQYIQRIDSKSENKQFEKLQEELDNNSTDDITNKLNLLEFQENTFSYPFVITTFVRFFETLLSNRNSELLKLPNFSNCIFLLDEIQSLPPRLYGFFIAYLSKFCEKYNSYAVISTATQPNFSLPNANSEAKEFFSDYKEPTPLLPLSYFDNNLFCRYQIQKEDDLISIEKLKDRILSENKSVLVILNTIDDTKDLYNLLRDELDTESVILLNTHFTPQHRKLKIYLAKRRLRENKRIIIISTQLIEAGVDIDFPVLYRDFTTVSSIVQSAGRCNRNGKIPNGQVRLVKLQKEGKERSKLIYRGKDEDLLRFTNESFTEEEYQENKLLIVQRNFFNRIQTEFHFAKHWLSGNNNLAKPDFDFMKDIQQCMYEKIGKFQLIDKLTYGEELQYYVAKNERDNKFEMLLQKQEELFDMFRNKVGISIVKSKKKEIEFLIKKMSNQIVQIRLKKNQQKPILGDDRNYFNLFKISGLGYSFKDGVDLKGEYIL